MKLQKNIVTILVCPENPDNIGAAARALKNMGFSELRLVQPPPGWRVKSKKMAMSAGDLLKKAKSFPSLKKAGADLQRLIGTTRRASEGRGRFVDFFKAVSEARRDCGKIRTGIVFGCESKGLANRDIRLCDILVTIPTGRAYPSLNLAQAVMVVLFSVAFPQDAGIKTGVSAEGILDKKEVEITLRHFEAALRALGYREGGAELLPRILRTMRELIKRSGLFAREAQMIKGLSRRIRERIREPR